MEPADIKSTPPDDGQLEAWYRANLSTAPLPDDGFSQRVLAALPTHKRRSTIKRRVFCLGGALTGTVVVLIGSIISDNASAEPPVFGPDFADSLALLNSPAFGLAVGITLVSLWFVFRPKLRLLPRL